ncbi:MAG: glycosyltransferase family 39 protein [Patescibacteria group bacterium]|nr:glycosyltransferase family 39 protein [Patescibacteria group bacterium]
MSSFKKAVIAGGLFLVAALPFVWHLGSASPFLDYDEATYARVFTEAVHSGNFLSFTYLGNHWFEKPPLYFWLMAGSAKVFGISEFALRFPSALLGILCVLLTAALALRLSKDVRAGALAGLLLAATGEFVYAARQVRMDIPVTAAILAAVYVFVRGWDDDRWYAVIGPLVGLGVLMKSVIGFLAFPIMLIFAAVYRRWKWLKDKYFWLGMAVMALVAAPWHIYESLKFGMQFWGPYFGYHILYRFTHTITGNSLGTTLWYIFVLAEPLVLLSAIGLVLLWDGYTTQDTRYRLPVAAGLSALFILVLFACSQTKLIYYFEPMYPFAAIFVAAVVLMFTDRLSSTAVRRISYGCLALLIATGIAGSFWQGAGERIGFSTEYYYTVDEYHIATYLADHPLPQAIYALGWDFWETLRYYDQGRPIDVAPAQSDPHGFFLIVPGQVLSQYSLSPELQKRAHLRYQGPALSLFEVDPA